MRQPCDRSGVLILLLHVGRCDLSGGGRRGCSRHRGTRAAAPCHMSLGLSPHVASGAMRMSPASPPAPAARAYPHASLLTDISTTDRTAADRARAHRPRSQTTCRVSLNCRMLSLHPSPTRAPRHMPALLCQYTSLPASHSMANPPSPHRSQSICAAPMCCTPPSPLTPPVPPECRSRV